MSDEKPTIAQDGPYRMDLEPGKYFWCSCGKSANQPFCDGSHAGTSFAPEMINLTEPKTVFLCGCKHSGAKPFCDGAHADL